MDRQLERSTFVDEALWCCVCRERLRTFGLCAVKVNNSVDVHGRERSTATQTGTESQIIQLVRGCISSRLFLSFSTLVNLEPKFHCSPCSPVRGSLQHEDSVSNLIGSNHGCGLPQAARLTHWSVASYESFAYCFLLGNVTVLRRLLVHRHGLLKHPHRDIRLRVTYGGKIVWKTRECPLCRGKTTVTDHLIDGVQAFAENHVHRFSA